MRLAGLGPPRGPTTRGWRPSWLALQRCTRLAQGPAVRLEHDIAGARGAPCPAEGVESLFIGGGIHAEELKLGTEEKAEAGESLNAGALERLLASRPAAQRPTLAMSWYRV